MHPFEIYKLYLNIKFHFNSKKFIFDFDNCISANATFSSFDASENDKICSQMQRFSKLELTELFISNMILEPKIPLRFFLFSTSHNIRKNWKIRIKNIEQNFVEDLTKHIFIDVKNFKELKRNLFILPPKTNLKNIDSFEDLISSNVQVRDTCSINKWIKKCNPETLTILDHIYTKKYNESFLLPIIKKEFKPYDDYLRLYKYQHFLNFEEINSKSNIKRFIYDC